MVAVDEVSFEPGVFLLAKVRALALKGGVKPATPTVVPGVGAEIEPGMEPTQPPYPETPHNTRTFRIIGQVSPEVWNRLGTEILPKLRMVMQLQVGIDFSVTVDAYTAKTLESELLQALNELSLTDKVCVE